MEDCEESYVAYRSSCQSYLARFAPSAYSDCVTDGTIFTCMLYLTTLLRNLKCAERPGSCQHSSLLYWVKRMTTQNVQVSME